MSDNPVNTAIATISTVSDGTGIFSSIDGATREGKLATLAALSNAVPISDNLDKPIALKDVILQAVTVNDTATGEPVDAVRTYLIAEDGTAYAAVSTGIVSSLRNIFAVLGNPNMWDGIPLPIKVKEERGKSGRRYMTIELA